MNYRTIAKLLGLLLIGISIFMATSIIFAVWSDGMRSIITFVVSTLITATAGSALFFVGRKEKGTIHAREAVVSGKP